MTSKQEELYNFVLEFSSKNGKSPTLAEIARRFSLSIGTIQAHLKVLKDSGRITIIPNISRGIITIQDADWRSRALAAEAKLEQIKNLLEGLPGKIENVGVPASDFWKIPKSESYNKIPDKDRGRPDFPEKFNREPYE